MGARRAHSQDKGSERGAFAMDLPLGTISRQIIRQLQQAIDAAWAAYVRVSPVAGGQFQRELPPPAGPAQHLAVVGVAVPVRFSATPWDHTLRMTPSKVLQMRSFESSRGGMRGRNGAARGIRTPDPLITNEVLYQLSYCGIPRRVPRPFVADKSHARLQPPKRARAIGEFSYVGVSPVASPALPVVPRAVATSARPAASGCAGRRVSCAAGLARGRSCSGRVFLGVCLAQQVSCAAGVPGITKRACPAILTRRPVSPVPCAPILRGARRRAARDWRRNRGGMPARTPATTQGAKREILGKGIRGKRRPPPLRARNLVHCKRTRRPPWGPRMGKLRPLHRWGTHPRRPLQPQSRRSEPSIRKRPEGRVQGGVIVPAARAG